VPLGNLIDNGKPKAGSRRFCGKIGRKNGGLNLCLDARPRVGHGDAEHAIGQRARTHAQGAAVIHGLNRVEKKIQQSLSEPLRADAHQREARFHFKNHGNVLGLEVCLGKPQRPPDDLAKISLHGFKRTGTRKLQQLGNHAVQPFHFVNHALGGFFLAPAHGHALGDVQGHALDGAQGVADFMRHTRRQMPKGRQPVIALGVSLKALHFCNVAQHKYVAQKSAVLIAHGRAAKADGERFDPRHGERCFLLQNARPSSQPGHQGFPLQTGQTAQPPCPCSPAGLVGITLRSLRARRKYFCALLAEHSQRRVVDHGNAPVRVADHKAKWEVCHNLCGHGLLIAHNTPPATVVVHPEQGHKTSQPQGGSQCGRKQVIARVLRQSILKGARVKTPQGHTHHLPGGLRAGAATKASHWERRRIAKHLIGIRPVNIR